MKKVYILGSINTDFTVSAVRMPETGETVMGQGFFTAQGGKGANQAVACVRMGGCVAMCGAVGDDGFGKSAVESLEGNGVDVSNIRFVRNSHSGAAVIILSDNDNRIVISPGANSLLSKEDIDSFLLGASKDDIFLTQLENPVVAVGYALKTAKGKGMQTILNPAPVNDDIIPFLSFCDMVIPNETECELLGGAQRLKGMVGTVIVTLGDKGYMILNGDGCRQYPCEKVQAVDTTAAGDTFCGSLGAFISKGKCLEDAAAMAAKAASAACTKMGAQPSIPCIEDLNM